MEDHSFPADVRIKSRLDFDRAFREGIVVADDVSRTACHLSETHSQLNKQPILTQVHLRQKH
jgi:hypothetical protein